MLDDHEFAVIVISSEIDNRTVCGTQYLRAFRTGYENAGKHVAAVNLTIGCAYASFNGRNECEG